MEQSMWEVKRPMGKYISRTSQSGRCDGGGINSNKKMSIFICVFEEFIFLVYFEDISCKQLVR